MRFSLVFYFEGIFGWLEKFDSRFDNFLKDFYYN